jgi:hypothetical integral membrane protein (TIGR02206 family)
MFNTGLKNTFIIFGASHINALTVVLLLAITLIYFRHFFRTEKHDKFMRYFLVTITIGQEIILNIYRYNFGQFTLEIAIPLHLCSIAILMTSYVLLTKNVEFFKQSYLVMLIGAVLAMATPSIENGYGFPHFRYFQFFVSHGLIAINFIYILVVMRFYRFLDYKDVWRNYRTLIILSVIALTTNILVGGNANYMYLMGVPGKGTAFDLLGPHPWYLFNIALLIAPLLLHVLYLPMTLKKRVE